MRHFTGRARVIPRCPHRLCNDHTASACPRSPIGAAVVTAPSTWTQYPIQGTQSCRNFNEGRCRKPQRRYQHLCLSCNEGHPYMSCPTQESSGKDPKSSLPRTTSGTRIALELLNALRQTRLFFLYAVITSFRLCHYTLMCLAD